MRVTKVTAATITADQMQTLRNKEQFFWHAGSVGVVAAIDRVSGKAPGGEFPEDREMIADRWNYLFGERHCDDYIHDHAFPACLRFWILMHRLPAADQLVAHEAGAMPKLFADYNGRRVCLVVASALGDVGITSVLDGDPRYDTRVWLANLSNFGNSPCLSG